MNSNSPKSKNKITLNDVIIFICFLCAFVLGIKSLREPDLWWQIRTGQWILEHGSVPKADVFSYTFQGVPWINIKWGFEVIAALITKFSGPENIFILQGIVNLLIVFFLMSSAKEFGKRIYSNGEIKPSFQFALIISIIIFLIASEYRMIGRPEMFSHLFTVIFLFLFLQAGNNLSGKIFLIIPLQLIWANMHEAFGTGIIISGAFFAGAWFEYFYSDNKVEAKKRAFWYSTVLVLSILVILINPNGTKLLLQPFQILHQVYANKYTVELLSFTASAFWKKEAWIAISLILVSILFLFNINRNKNKNKIKINRFKKNDTGYLLLFVAFVYLASTAYRNIIFFSLWSFPLIVVSLEWMFSKFLSKENYFKRIRFSLLVLATLFYMLIVSGKYYKIISSRDRFGLEVLSIYNPVGAADYIRSQHLENKKCFSDYLSSSYLLYALSPDFKTYIDLRDFDIFPPEFFDDYIQKVNNPIKFHELDSVMQFDYVVLYRLQDPALHTMLYNDSIYALTYLDAVSAVYQKTDSFSHSDIFTRSRVVKAGFLADVINHLLNPFYRHYDFSDYDADDIAGHYYLRVMRYDLASIRAENMLQKKDKKDKGLTLFGEISYQKALHETDGEKKRKFLDEAENYLNQSLDLNYKSFENHYLLALIFYQLSETDDALSEFEKSLALNSDQSNVHISIGQIYKRLFSENGNKILAQKMADNFVKADKLSPGNPETQFNAGLAFYFLHDCNRAVGFFEDALKSKNLDNNSRKMAEKYIKDCNQ